MLFNKNASFSLCIFQKCPFGLKITSAQKCFWWHYFLRCHGPPGPHGPAQKLGIYSIFLNVFVWPLVGNIISSRFRKTLEKVSENAPEMLQRSTKVQRFMYNMCMTGNSQFCTVFPAVKPSIHPQLNTPTSIRTLKIVHFISNDWNIMGKCF